MYVIVTVPPEVASPPKNTPGTPEPLYAPIFVANVRLTVGPEVYRPKFAANTFTDVVWVTGLPGITLCPTAAVPENGPATALKLSDVGPGPVTAIGTEELALL